MRPFTSVPAKHETGTSSIYMARHSAVGLPCDYNQVKVWNRKYCCCQIKPTSQSIRCHGILLVKPCLQPSNIQSKLSTFVSIQNTMSSFPSTLSQIYPHLNWKSKLNTKLRLEFQVENSFKLESQVELLIRRERVKTDSLCCDLCIQANFVPASISFILKTV